MQKSAAYTGHVRGTVQGVFFRASAEKKAAALGLSGWVRNEPDGSVAFLVAGEVEALNVMREWLQTGPPNARVQALDWLPCDDPGLDGFQIRA